jgi:uncharacterized protein (DUF885 family)
MTRILNISVLLLVTIAFTQLNVKAQDSSIDTDEKLLQLIEDVEEFRGQDHSLPIPEGTNKRYSDRYTAISEDYYINQANEAEKFLDQLEAIDKSDLSTDLQLDAAVLERQLRNQIASAEFRSYLIPIGVAGGFHISLARQAKNRRFQTVDDYDDYIAKLQSFKEYTRRQLDLMRTGLEEGITMPAEVISGFQNIVSYHIVDTVENTIFYRPFKEFPASVSDEDRRRILRDGTKAIEESVIPAMEELYDFVVDEYIPNTRESGGISEVPGGQEYYEHQVQYHTTLDLTPEEVHKMGLEEVENIRKEMEKVIDRTDFEGTFEEFLQFMRTDPQFYVDTQEEYIKELSNVAKRMDLQLLNLFKELPETPYGIVPIPEFIAPRAVGAYYGIGTADQEPGKFHVNLSDMSSRPLYVLGPLVFHEGAPGHHLQIMLQRENEDISEFRRGYEVGVMVEGWALYSEGLGKEVGFYTDPYMEFGQLAYEMYRACRLVVNTGIHALGWTREEAINFYYKNVAFSKQRITNEVDRNYSGSGYFLNYKIGELKIRELRQRAEKELDEHFDIREFHRQVLKNGSVPLPFLERQIESYIEETLNSKKQKAVDG